MADGDHNGIMEVVSHGLVASGGETVTVVTGNVEGETEDGVTEGVTEEDILQQALDEASESYTEGSVQYTMMDTQIVNSVGEGVTFITENGEVATADGELDGTYETTTYRVIGSVANGDTISFPVESDASAAANSREEQIQLEQAVINEIIQESASTQIEMEAAADENLQPVDQVDEPSEQQTAVGDRTSGITVSMYSSNPGSGAPLGSSQNPIRIIQQGNQYTPVQQLTTDQLQQIMQVVQQQQVAKSGSESGSCVLYNPQTNTRIVYRVIYPTELHKGPDGEGAKSQGQQTVFLQNTPKRTYKKRNKDDDEKIEGPELSKEEKEQRKKAKQKTRSGRVSKPPKHMVQDYKHIHVLDFDEDLDDSDGGYSDYRVSDEEGGDSAKSRKDDQEKYISPGIFAGKPKNWKCETCSKAYIGKAGLARHFKLYPSHGSVDEDGEITGGTEIDGNTPSETPNGVNSTASFSEDSRDSTSSLSFTPVTRPRGRGGYRGRRSWRGRGAAGRMDSENRRKMKLKEIVKECSDEELMEIVLPRLAKVISLWEFLLMKVEKGNPAKPSVEDVYQEFGNIHQGVKKMCQDCLELVSEEENSKSDTHYLKVENIAVADSLGLKLGLHKVKEIPTDDKHYIQPYKLLTTNKEVNEAITSRSFFKRTVEVVSSAEDLVTPAKKPKTFGTDLKTQGSNSVFSQTVFCTSSSGGKSSDSHSTVPVKVTNSGAAAFKVMPASAIKSIVPVANNKGVAASISTAQKTTLTTANVMSATSKAVSNSVQVLGNNLNSATVMQPSLKSSSPKQVSLLTSSNLKSLSSSPAKQQLQSYYVVSGRPSLVANNANIVTLSNSTSQSGGLSQPQLIVPTLQQNSTSAVSTISSSTSSNILSFSATDLTNSSAMNGTSVLTNLNATSLLTKKLGSSIENNKTSCKTVLDKLTNVNPDASSVSSVSINLAKVSEAIINTSASVVSNSVLTEDSDGTNSSLSADVYTDTSTLTILSEGDSKPVVKTKPDHSFVSESSQTAALLSTADSQLTVLASGGSFMNDPENPGSVVYAVSNSVNSELSSNDPDSFVVQAESGLPVTVVEEDADMTVGEEEGNQSGLESNVVLSQGFTDRQEMVSIINGAEAEPQEQVTDMTSILSTDEQLEADGTRLVQLEAGAIEGEVEAVQIPSTNIFQTADGVIIIQNPDGSTVQLQGSDGQSVSLETVQALLAMDGATQFITEQTEEQG